MNQKSLDKRKEIIWTAKQPCEPYKHKNVVKNELGLQCQDCGAYVDTDMVINLVKK